MDQTNHRAAEGERLRRLRTRAEVLLGRARARARALAVIAAAFVVLSAFGGLAGAWALAGLLSVWAVVVALPGGPDDQEHEAAGGRGGDGDQRRSRGTDADGWRALVDAIPDAALALDPAGNVLHHNAIAGELFPMIKAGQPLTHASRNPELIAAAERAISSPEPIVVQLFERVPMERRIEATLSRLRKAPASKSLPALLVTFRDLAEQDRLAQMRADFIANASHELRTPLASLKGFVETLQGPAREDPEARTRFLTLMASQAARMTRLIDDLLSLSRVEMRVHLPPKGIVDLNEVASYVAQTLEPLAQSSKIAIAVKRLPGLARIRGDRDEIVQVLQNLVHNALKYGREGGHVDIGVTRETSTQPPTERLALAVTDDGPGIEPEHLPRLTERFYRANIAKSREKGGTGLGLAIVKHIVLRHRGDLRIASEVGKGSTFTVLFDEYGRAQG